MRIKKGFTLAEILIVLMVIGVLATMTIPSLIKGVQEAQYKTAYKKALNAIINLTAMERLSGNLPTKPGDQGASVLYDLMASSLSVKGYVPLSTIGLNSGTKIDAKDFLTTKPNNAGGKVKNDDGTETDVPVDQLDSSRYKNWIVSEDNIAYLVTKGGITGTNNCVTKSQILSNQHGKTAGPTNIDTNIQTGESPETGTQAEAACFVVYVDVNGLTSTPNQVDNNYVASGNTTPAIPNDQFPIYIGIDGATAGDQTTTVTGRIAGDLKQ